MERFNQTPVLRMMRDLDFTQATAIFVLTAIVTVWLYKRIMFRKLINNIEEKHVLITGCDSGFGRAAAIALDKLGFYVFATCLTSKGEEELKLTCSEKLKTISLDVTRSDEVQSALQEVKRFLQPSKGLWGLVNNAGIARIGPIEWSSLEDFKEVADVNLWGVVDVTKAFLPLVKKAKGRIVNVGSIGGRACLPHASAYSISKYGVAAFSDALRRETSACGVAVSIIEPGFFKTHLTDKGELVKLWQSTWNNLSVEMQEEYGERFFQTSVRNMLKGMVDTCASSDIHKVVDIIKDALTSTAPKTHYVVGWDANCLWIWISRLPAKVGDAILKMLGEDVRPQFLEKRFKKVKDENMNGVVKK